MFGGVLDIRVGLLLPVTAVVVSAGCFGGGPFHPGRIFHGLSRRIMCIFVLGWFPIQVEVCDSQRECVLTAQVGLALGPHD